MFVGPDYIVTVRYGQAAPLAGVRADLEARPERLADGPGAVLQAALAYAVDSYRPVVAGLFGMNLGGIPGGESPVGFTAVTLLTAMLCFVLYRKFKSAEWL
jgi:Mg2+ and Co2+ transporter CorA